MKKQLLLVMAMVLSSVASFAQYSFSGTLLTTGGAPVSGQTVYIMTDSLSGWNGLTHGPGFMVTAVTTSTGAI